MVLVEPEKKGGPYTKKEQEERTKSLILETLRQEHSNKSKTSANKKLEEQNKAKQKEIEDLKKQWIELKEL